MIEESHYLAGKRHGQYKAWWNNGTIKEEGVFNLGRRAGIYRWYTSTGELIQEHDYADTA